MTPGSRFFLRLRRGLLRFYEALLLAAMLAMAFAAFSPAASAGSDAQGPGLQCGKSRGGAP